MYGRDVTEAQGVPRITTEATDQSQSANHCRDRQPRRALLCRVISRCCPTFTTLVTRRKGRLPNCIRQRFRRFLRYKQLRRNFLQIHYRSYRTRRLITFDYGHHNFYPDYKTQQVTRDTTLLISRMLPRRPVHR